MNYPFGASAFGVYGIASAYGMIFRNGYDGLYAFNWTDGKIVWEASSTKGGIDVWDRLFGGGGRPMNDVTRDAVNDVIEKLFK